MNQTGNNIDFKPMGNVNARSNEYQINQPQEDDYSHTAEKENPTSERQKYRNIGKKIIAALAVAAGLAAAAYANKEASENRAVLSREQWEAQMNDAFQNYDDLSIIYNAEDGSDVSFTRGYNNTHYEIHDQNSDGRPESGEATRNGLTVSFEENEDGTLASSAVRILDGKLDRQS